MVIEKVKLKIIKIPGNWLEKCKKQSMQRDDVYAGIKKHNKL
ncbi:hypothetical protein [Peribacillus frigoritolerans]|nr:hypothetical protein [Peribacillus frigoritolerans]